MPTPTTFDVHFLGLEDICAIVYKCAHAEEEMWSRDVITNSAGGPF